MAICPDDPHAALATHPATPQTVRRHRMLRPPLHEASLAFLSFCIFSPPGYRTGGRLWLTPRKPFATLPPTIFSPLLLQSGGLIRKPYIAVSWLGIPGKDCHHEGTRVELNAEDREHPGAVLAVLLQEHKQITIEAWHEHCGQR